MARITRLTVMFAALAASLGALTSPAGAVTWHNTGNTAFTATGGPVTFSVGANNLACSAVSATGAAPGGMIASTVYPISGTLTMSPCTLAGQSWYRHCNYTFTGTSFAAGVTTGSMDMTCVSHLIPSNVGLCHFEGSAPASYTNPSGSARGKFTFSTSSTLTVTNSAGTCPLGTGSVTMTEHTVTITNASGGVGSAGPVLNRT
jgi:hypothetical protein